MSLFDSLVAAVLKADKENNSTPPTQTPPTQAPPTQAPPTQAPPTQTPPTQTPPNEFDYKAEYEKMAAENINLQKQLSEAQKANLNLLNMTPVNDTESFSDIMRKQEYHPLYERSK